MDKATIADVLEKIATLLELKGENPFKIRAYTNAARSLETWGGNFATCTTKRRSRKFPGIGKAIAAKIKELVETGSLQFFEDLRAEFPAEILELFSLPGLGAKKIKALYEQLQVSSIAQLQAACDRRPGRGAARLRQNDAGKTWPGDRRTRETRRIVSARRDRGRSRNVAGRSARSSRRAPRLHCRKLSAPKKEIVRDLDFIVATTAPAEITAIFVATSAGRIGHRAGADEIERAVALRHSMRSARGERGGVSVCAQLFYRKQGAQHRDAKSRAATRLDLE